MNQAESITKKCNKCQEIKPISEFYIRKDNNTYRNECKKCRDAAHKLYRKKHPEKDRLYNKKWARNNPEKRKLITKNWCIENEQRYKENIKQWKIKNRKYLNKYEKEKRKNNINFKITCNLRHRIHHALKQNWKRGHTLQLLGCDINKLKMYLEKLFTIGMTWKNYGKGGWDIDHIIPCSSFDLSNPEQQKKCFHYTNLQPLWHKDNLIKSDRIMVYKQSV